MREELALKAAILAEKFAPDLSWYVSIFYIEELVSHLYHLYWHLSNVFFFGPSISERI